MRITLILQIVEPASGRILAVRKSAKSITLAGYEHFIRAACDPAGRPPLINTLGIGWGPGSTTPFDENQTSLQGSNTSLKLAGWTYDPATNRRSCTFSASWGVGEPVAQLILIGELGLFRSDGVMVDRTPITPTPKYAQHAALVHAVLDLAQSETAFTFS